MKNLNVTLFLFGCLIIISCDQNKDQKTNYNQGVGQTINTFYGDALEFKESYNLLRILSKDIGQRLSGSEGAKKAVQWTKKVMEDYGFDSVYLQPVMVPHWERDKSRQEAYFFNSDGKKINLAILAAGGSVSTPKTGLSAGVVEVKSLEEVDRLGEEGVGGKIVFYNKAFNPRFINQGNSYGSTGFQRRSGAIKASEYGAVASVFRSLSSSDDDVPHTGSMSYKDVVDSIPHAGLGVVSAKKLSAELKTNKELKLFLNFGGKWYPDALSHNVIGELKGSEFPNEIITVGGHLDSWDVGEGAHDDGAGCVHAIGALRLFQKQNISPKRTIRAVMFMNEENGLKGGSQYAKNAKDYQETHIAAIESDASAYVPRGFGFSGSDEQLKKLRGWLKYFDKNTISYFSKGGGGADIGPLHRSLGTPMFGLSVDGQKYFEMHHTEKDVFELVNARELELGTASLASLIFLIDKYGL